MPTGAERDRSSVGGALELSGTGARSGWSADVRCEHPVGGPCVSGPMKVRHADQRSAGDKGGSFRRTKQQVPRPLALQTWAVRPFASQQRPGGPLRVDADQ